MADKNINIILKVVDKMTKDLKKAGWSLNSFAKKNEATFKKMSVRWTAAFAAIGYWVKKLVDQASDLEETTQKFNVVYRDLGKEANKAAKDIAEWYWLSQQASKQFLADLWDITSWFGLSQEASLDYATQVTKLWVDLASFANIAWWSEEAIDRLNKWFLGEHENLKALGIIINDTMLKKQLLADWTSELTWLELEQAKIQARMTIAMSQSANALWDFERSKASLANQTRILTAKFDDMTTALGMAFLPIITKITTALVPVIESFAGWAEENPELIKTITLVALWLAGLVAILWTLWLVLPAVITWLTLLTWPIWLIVLAIWALAIWANALFNNFPTYWEQTASLKEQMR